MLGELQPGEGPRLTTATDNDVKLYEYKWIYMQNDNKQPIIIPFFARDLSQPILSVTGLAEQGLNIQLNEPTITQQRLYITTYTIRRLNVYVAPLATDDLTSPTLHKVSKATSWRSTMGDAQQRATTCPSRLVTSRSMRPTSAGFSSNAWNTAGHKCPQVDKPQQQEQQDEAQHFRCEERMAKDRGKTARQPRPRPLGETNDSVEINWRHE